MIECDPSPSVDVMKVAWPAAFTFPEPMVDAPSLNITVPVGVAVAVVIMVAVKVTGCPTPDGLADELTVVVVVACVTDCVSAAEVLAANVVFAAYEAVIVCTPAVRSTVVKLAIPVAFSVPVPIAAAPSKKVTDPVGVPEPLLTVAVKVIDCVNVAGLAEEVTVVVVAMPFTV